MMHHRPYVPHDSILDQNELLNQAIHFAVSKHAGQVRKGTTTPYILHPLETMLILKSMDADPVLLMAGVLHDTIEDTDTTADEISKLFGADVAELVNAHSEDKSKTWKQRKTHAIEELVQADRRLKMLVMADKVSNLRSIAADYRALGDNLWERFNAPKQKQAWYYSGIQDALWDMQTDPDAGAVYWEMVNLYKDVFVTYYRVHAFQPPGYYEDYLLQVSANGEAYLLVKGNPEWEKESNFDDLLEEEYKVIPRREAEALEDEWNDPFWKRHEEDLRTQSCSLINGRDKWAKITVEDGKLTLSGAYYDQDDEYEYFVSLDEDNTKRLLVQLRLKYGLHDDAKMLFLQAFGKRMPSTKLMDFCDKKKVKYSFHSC